jgi:phosphoribosyl-AMP cyclohydrolase
MRKQTSTRDLEEGRELQLDFDKLVKVVAQCPKVIPVAVQDADSKELILVAYTNEEALRESIKTRIATFWSTSKNAMWVKGATSGNYYEILEVFVNCEQNSLLYLVRSRGEGICHTRSHSGRARNCFYRRLDLESGRLENVDP